MRGVVSIADCVTSIKVLESPGLPGTEPRGRALIQRHLLLIARVPTVDRARRLPEGVLTLTSWPTCSSTCSCSN